MGDPIGTGSGVLAFVLLALKSAKVAHEILSSFKDGPENVKRAKADVESLLSVLERLSHCRALEANDDNGAFFVAVGSCLRDVQSFDKQLSRLVPKAKISSRRSNYWKRLMAVWEEEMISKTSARLASHAANLSLHLSALQSDVVVAVPGQLNSITQELAAQRSAQDAHRAEQSRLTSSLKLVEGGITSIGGRLETVQETVQTISSTTAAHQLETRTLLEKTQGSLEQILQLVTQLSLRDQGASRAVEIRDRDAAKDPMGEQPHRTAKNEPCKELTSVIARLCRMVEDSQATSQGKTKPKVARDIKEDIRRALELMMSDEFHQVVSRFERHRSCQMRNLPQEPHGPAADRFNGGLLGPITCPSGHGQ
ncbi:hypothetical protein VTG60DRAFT_5946 [Thermothelomyces hinnuleus]